MKALYKLAWIIPFGIFILYSCTKRKIIEEPTPVVIIDVEDRYDSIEVGNTANKTILRHNKVVFGTEANPDVYAFDVNQDGKNDFKLISKDWGGEFGNETPAAELYSLHPDSYFHTEVRELSTFLRTTESVSKGRKVEKIIHKYLSCESERGSVLHKTELVSLPSTKRDYDFIRAQGSWEGNFMPLTQAPHEYPVSSVSETADSIIYQKIHYDLRCRGLQDGREVYLGIKIIDSAGKVKLGWMKLRIVNFKHITLVETVIEQ